MTIVIYGMVLHHCLLCLCSLTHLPEMFCWIFTCGLCLEDQNGDFQHKCHQAMWLSWHCTKLILDRHYFHTSFRYGFYCKNIKLSENKLLSSIKLHVLLKTINIAIFKQHRVYKYWDLTASPSSILQDNSSAEGLPPTACTIPFF